MIASHAMTAAKAAPPMMHAAITLMPASSSVSAATARTPPISIRTSCTRQDTAAAVKCVNSF